MANRENMKAQPTLTGHFASVWLDASVALAEMSRTSRWLHVFWLIGPLILLIERSPADVWLTICALAFAVRAVLKRDGSWLRVFWVRAVFAFWGVCMLSAALSELPSYSIGEAFIWIRFPFFLMATFFWFSLDKRLVKAMFAISFIAMIAMSIILLAELIIVGQTFGRLSWPYGDFVPGGYLAKAMLPIFCVCVAMAMSNKARYNNFFSVVCIFSLVMSVFTGERINFLIRFFSGLLSSFFWRPNIVRLWFVATLLVTSCLCIILFEPEIVERYFHGFIRQLPIYSDSSYFMLLNAGYKLFQFDPIFGIGTGNFRILCDSFLAGFSGVECDNHPHNYYIQLLAETGLFGFLTGVVMIMSIIWQGVKISKCGSDNVFCSVAMITPFALFFPLQTTADFFGQWNNIFLWTGISIALSARAFSADACANPAP